jgi:hypothetical protein
MSPAMRETLQKLRQQYVIGFLGGSDLAKITEQLTSTGEPGKLLASMLAELWKNLILHPSHQ